MHALHDEHAGVVLFDGCVECASRAGSLKGLSNLDNPSLRTLADIAARPDLFEEKSSWDRQAVETLRLAGRIVFASGITEEVCR